MDNRLLCYLLTATLFAAVTVSCSGDKQPAAYLDEEGHRQLNVPEVPSSVDSLEVGNYRVAHYWDYMDFEADSLIDDPCFMRQSIHGYLRLFPAADSVTIRRSVDAVLARAEVDTMAYSYFFTEPERYLIMEYPSMEDYYLYFADAFLASDFVSETDKEYPRFYREVVMKNRVGGPAADLQYLTPEGDSARLSDLRGVPTVLYIYNAGCSICYDVARHLSHSEVLSELLHERKIDLLAVSKTGPEETWRELLDRFPDGWQHGYAVEALSDLTHYAVFEVPAIYLIDASGLVLLKNAKPQQLERYLEEHELPAIPRPIRLGTRPE